MALIKRIDIEPYITPNWDESYNVNRLTKRRMKKVKKYLLRYCDKRDGDIISQRFDYYQSIDRPNFSTNYLEELIRRGKIKASTSSSLEKLCF